MAGLPPNFDRTSDLGPDCVPPGLVGKTVGRYQVEEYIGGGGEKEVYRARDTLLRRSVALKRPRPGKLGDERSRKRLLREARAASALDHPAIAAIHDVFEHDGGPFIVEEFVEGISLRQRLNAPLELKAFYTIAEDCAEALAAAAERGIVHCDLKPENIMIRSNGRPKIVDFGIARRTALSDQDLTQTTEAVDSAGRRLVVHGTPGYLAPEVVKRETLDARTDIFSLDVVFYEMLTGVNPYLRKDWGSMIEGILKDNPHPPSFLNASVPAGLDDVVLRMLAKDPAHRYATPAELLEDLRRIRERQFRRRRPLPLAAAALSGAILAVVAAALWPRPSASERTRYLAIAPFKNLSVEPEFEFFSIGLTGALQGRLALLKGISVVDPTKDVTSVPDWKPLRAELIVEGEIQRSQDRVRINYRILEGVDAVERVIVDSGSLDGKIGEIFELQDEVAERICRAVADHCGIEFAMQTAEQPTSDPLAYDLYLRARGYLSRPEESRNVDMAVELFQMALARDGKFAVARAGLGEAFWSRFLTTRDTTWAAEALAAAREAVAAATDRAEPRITLATILMGNGSVDSAAAEFRRATEIDPENGAGFHGLAKAQERLGELRAAEETFKRAIEVRPSDWRKHNDLGVFYFRRGRIEEALASFRRVVELAPDSARGYSNLGAMYQSLGRTKEALEFCERSLALEPSLRAYANLATLYLTLGRNEDAARNYEKALAIEEGDYRVWAGLAGSYKRIPGMKVRADGALDRAIDLAERQRAADPRDALLLATLSQFYAERGRAADARQAVESALAIAPNQPKVLFFAASTFETLGDRTASLDAIAKAVRLGLPIEVVRIEPELASLVKDFEGARGADTSGARGR